MGKRNGDQHREPRKLLRRNQIIITALALMIAAAGYLNYSGRKMKSANSDGTALSMPFLSEGNDISQEDILAENQSFADLTEIPSWEEDPDDAMNEVTESGEAQQEAGVQSTESGMEQPGEAVLTSGKTVSDYIAGVLVSREQIRAKNRDTLMGIINNTNIDEAAKAEAIQNMIKMTDVMEKENAAETMLIAKGFADPVVSITDGKVDIVINAQSLTDAERAQIEDVVKRKTEEPAENIIISLMSLDGDISQP